MPFLSSQIAKLLLVAKLNDDSLLIISSGSPVKYFLKLKNEIIKKALNKGLPQDIQFQFPAFTDL